MIIGIPWGRDPLYPSMRSSPYLTSPVEFFLCCLGGAALDPEGPEGGPMAPLPLGGGIRGAAEPPLDVEGALVLELSGMLPGFYRWHFIKLCAISFVIQVLTILARNT